MKIAGLILAVLWAAVAGRATTVVPPSFDELVRDSELIFRGRVTAVKSDWSGEGKGRAPATWVTFAVERTLRGSAGETITLGFMGGEVGSKRLVLAGRIACIHHTFVKKFFFHGAHRVPNRGHGAEHPVRSVASVTHVLLV